MLAVTYQMYATTERSFPSRIWSIHSVSDRVKKSCIHTHTKLQKSLGPEHGPRMGVIYLGQQLWSVRGVRGWMGRFLDSACAGCATAYMKGELLGSEWVFYASSGTQAFHTSASTPLDYVSKEYLDHVLPKPAFSILRTTLGSIFASPELRSLW